MRLMVLLLVYFLLALLPPWAARGCLVTGPPGPPLKYLAALSITSSTAFLERLMTLVFNFFSCQYIREDPFSSVQKSGSKGSPSRHFQVLNDGESRSCQVAKKTVLMLLVCPAASQKLSCAELRALIVIVIVLSLVVCSGQVG